MKKILLLTVFTLLLGASVKTNAQQNIKASEISYGIYKSETGQRENLPGSPSGDHGVVTKQVLVKKTNKIPAQLHMEFGAEYSLNGTTSDPVTLYVEWIFPKEMVNTTKNTSYKSVKYPIQVPANGGDGSTYSLDNDFEIVKGTWQLNVYYGDKVIYSRKFELE